MTERVFGESKYFIETIEKYLNSTLTKMLIIIRHFLKEGALLGLKPMGIYTLLHHGYSTEAHAYQVLCKCLSAKKIELENKHILN